MKIAVFIALGLLILTFLLIWLVSRIRYQIGSRHFKVKLFGLAVRRIPLADIHFVTKRRPDGLAENWWNTLQPSHRMLIIRRHHGWIRNVVITPKNRYVLKTELEKAVKRINSPADDAPENVPLASE